MHFSIHCMIDYSIISQIWWKLCFKNIKTYRLWKLEHQKDCRWTKSIKILRTPFLDHHKSAIIRKTADINNQVNKTRDFIAASIALRYLFGLGAIGYLAINWFHVACIDSLDGMRWNATTLPKFMVMADFVSLPGFLITMPAWFLGAILSFLAMTPR